MGPGHGGQDQHRDGPDQKEAAAPPALIGDHQAHDRDQDQRRQKNRKGTPENERAGPGPTGEGDGDEPEIGHQHGQRAERHGRIEEAHREPAPEARLRRQCLPVDRRCLERQDGRAHVTSMRGRCSSARMSIRRHRVSAAAMPISTSTSASAAP